jgi:hypothetical protein
MRGIRGRSCVPRRPVVADVAQSTHVWASWKASKLEPPMTSVAPYSRTGPSVVTVPVRSAWAIRTGSIPEMYSRPPTPSSCSA